MQEHHRAQPSQRWGSGSAQPHTVPLGTHLPPARPPLARPQAEGLRAPRSLRRVRLFWAIVSPLLGGQVALSSAPVSHDSRRNPTLCAVVAGWAAVPRPRAAMVLCPPVSPPAVSPSLVALTAAGGTAALGVLQQLGGAAWPGGAPLPVSLLQPQPGRLILSKGAQVLRVAPIHLGEKEQVGASGAGLGPWLLHPSGETEAGERQASWHVLPAPEDAR